MSTVREGYINLYLAIRDRSIADEALFQQGATVKGKLFKTSPFAEFRARWVDHPKLQSVWRLLAESKRATGGSHVQTR